jgi:hypothetical protein
LRDTRGGGAPPRRRARADAKRSDVAGRVK